MYLNMLLYKYKIMSYIIIHSLLNSATDYFPRRMVQTFAVVMRHGSQGCDKIEDDLYQYNVE